METNLDFNSPNSFSFQAIWKVLLKIFQAGAWHL